MSLHHEAIRFRNAGRFTGNWQRQIIIQTTRTLHDCAPARNAAQNRNAATLALGAIYFARNAVGITNHNEWRRRFPKTERRLTEASLKLIEQSFVTRQILRGRSERYIQQPQSGHKSASVTAPRCAEFTSF